MEFNTPQKEGTGSEKCLTKKWNRIPGLGLVKENDRIMRRMKPVLNVNSM